LKLKQHFVSKVTTVSHQHTLRKVNCPGIKKTDGCFCHDNGKKRDVTGVSMHEEKYYKQRRKEKIAKNLQTEIEISQEKSRLDWANPNTV
jgi:hypothetical protein